MMNKKLLAVAVAGALAAPLAAFAQTTVTISGILKTGVDNLRITSPNVARTGNTSETRVTDNSSRIIFGITEDLGNGLSAIGQIDMRFDPDLATAGGAPTLNAGGNTWVGLKSKTMGTVVIGRADLHYGLFEMSDIVLKAGALMSAPVSLFDYVGTAAGPVAIAGNTRTNNVVMYDMPTFNGFDMRMAWSANPTGVESDLGGTGAAGTVTRKGQAWNINPKYTAGNWGVRYSYWDQKADQGATAAATPADQRGNTVLGWMTFGGLKVALAWNQSSLKNALTGVETNKRNAWSIPINYYMGPHNFNFHYTKAEDDKIAQAGGLNATGAKMWAAAYVYDLSKRTTVGVTYAQIKNNANGLYNFFTNGNTGVFGSTNGALLGGETGSLFAATVRHAF